MTGQNTPQPLTLLWQSLLDLPTLLPVRSEEEAPKGYWQAYRSSPQRARGGKGASVRPIGAKPTPPPLIRLGQATDPGRLAQHYPKGWQGESWDLTWVFAHSQEVQLQALKTHALLWDNLARYGDLVYSAPGGRLYYRLLPHSWISMIEEALAPAWQSLLELSHLPPVFAPPPASVACQGRAQEDLKPNSDSPQQPQGRWSLDNAVFSQALAVRRLLYWLGEGDQSPQPSAQGNNRQLFLERSYPLAHLRPCLRDWLCLILAVKSSHTPVNRQDQAKTNKITRLFTQRLVDTYQSLWNKTLTFKIGAGEGRKIGEGCQLGPEFIEDFYGLKDIRGSVNSLEPHLYDRQIMHTRFNSKGEDSVIDQKSFACILLALILSTQALALKLGPKASLNKG
jgi:hypothetical protein